MDAGTTFSAIAAVLALCALLGTLAHLAGQPPFIAYVLAGLIAGPGVLGLVPTDGPLTLLGELGVTVLLFVVGLKLEPDALRAWRAPVLLAALAQVAVCAGAGFATARVLGLDPLASAYVGAVVALSSTVVGVKLLWDAGELSSAHGRLALGFLLVQDVAAVAAMAVFSARGHAPASLGALALLAALVSLPLLAAHRRHLPAVAVLRHGEIVLVGALGWAALVAAVSEAAGLGKELGGLAAALSLALTPYREALAARLGSVRDFLCLCLFVGLGAAIVPAQLAGALPGALALATFALVARPALVAALLVRAGSPRQDAWRAGAALAPLSELGLVAVALGTQAGAVPATLAGAVTLGTLVSVVGAAPLRTLTARRVGSALERPSGNAAPAPDAVIYGLGHCGRLLATALAGQGQRVLGVDFDPAALRAASTSGVPTRYGDALDPDFPAALALAEVRWLIIAIPVPRAARTQPDPRHVLIGAARAAGFAGQVAVVVRDPADAPALRALGADVVLQPAVAAAPQAARALMGLVLTHPR